MACTARRCCVPCRARIRGRIALVSSFGTESAVLLRMAAAINQALPILFIDTGKLFGETLRYRDELVAFLGLTDVRTVRPSALKLQERDPDMMLWQKDADACCFTRKVEPLAQALKGFDAWITGRKRYQGGARGRPAANRGRCRLRQDQPARRDELRRHRGSVRNPPFAAPSARSRGFPLGRLLSPARLASRPAPTAAQAAGPAPARTSAASTKACSAAL